MELPDFLKRENRKPIDEETKEFWDMLNEYKKFFGEGVTTEMSSFSVKQWIEILKQCIEKKQIYEKLTGDVLEEDTLV